MKKLIASAALAATLVLGSAIPASASPLSYTRNHCRAAINAPNVNAFIRQVGYLSVPPSLVQRQADALIANPGAATGRRLGQACGNILYG